MILKQKFFNRPTLAVARDLLGKILVRNYRGKWIRAIITEVEAYDGFKDKASHASRGLTERNFPMFGPAGCWYVYFTYGMHWMLNVVTGPKDYPAAILIRAASPERSRRSTLNLNGPARLTKFFKIDKKFNNLPANKKTGLWIAAPLGRASPRHGGTGKFQIKRAPRVGVDYAGPVWAKKRYRFILM